MAKIRFGVIGISEGNGHPYSWSAIFNGYDNDFIKSCPFPVIPEYLSKQQYPENFLTEIGKVTHIWTQDREISESVANFAHIDHVVDEYEEMINRVDAILLARDDAENHYKYAKPFVEAGLPIFIDKPFALNHKAARKLWEIAKNENQIFSCSALQFAKEFQKNQIDYDLVGDIKIISATTPKSWNKYAVHIIEPVLNLIPDRGTLQKVAPLPIINDQMKGVQVSWTSGIIAQFQSMGNMPSPLAISIQGDKGYQELQFKDSFHAFKTALERFVGIIRGNSSNIPKSFTKEMVTILEAI